MKVGTDGTLLGAWAALPPHAKKILDIGTGSGLIAIMAAQRHPTAKITAIDIDKDCVMQATENAVASPWAERIEVIESLLQEYSPEEKFDVIISNPPYFADSMHSPDKQRTTARHTASLSFKELTEGVLRLLADDGLFAVILPTAESELLLSASRGRLFTWRRCEVWSTPESGARRIMLELKREPPKDLAQKEKIIIEQGGRHVYSEEYKALTADFYLNF
ncbi:MAG: methyltransferase [Alistipes sp.]|nr:methyltransferase [Alistipes sp.]